MLNWNDFCCKNNKKEAYAFEQLAYLLFCAEFNNRIGLFRYKNQTGIETEPLEKDNILYGFQAKYYETSISSNKNDIIDSIEKAKRENVLLSTIFLYTNQELSESKNKTKKKPQYQQEIEKIALDNGLNIVWRVPSHFEIQLQRPENKYIYDLFFNLNKNETSLLDEIKNHNDNILKSIQTEINFTKKQIKIDRSSYSRELQVKIQNNSNLIMAGEGGSGKTAIIKEFYETYKTEIPICIFKANELNVKNLNAIFSFNSNYTFPEFIDLFETEKSKLFIIDSAERLAEFTTHDNITDLLQKLSEKNWNIIFTTRYVYLNDLKFHLKVNYNLDFNTIDIPLLYKEELITLSEDYAFELPESINFLDRLKNLFYLNEYLSNYADFDINDECKNFINLLWRKRIQGSVQNNNLHIQREQALSAIAKERCSTGMFYIRCENLSQQALASLQQDEIIDYNDNHAGYFITHDIYEEWTLNKIISQNFANYSTEEQFFIDLGDNLPIRRAFRLWLSDKLCDTDNNIENFIKDSFSNNSINNFWKDEILISVLLSDYCEIFFEFFDSELQENDFRILRRILFLLKIACTDISSTTSFNTVFPKGKGWQTTIAFINKYKFSFFEKPTKLALSLLLDWCYINKTGKTTKITGLLALGFLEKKELDSSYYIKENLKEMIVKIVFNSASEIKEELRNIFENVITQKLTSSDNPYNILCTNILEKPYIATDLIKVLPESVIQLCNMFWKKEEKKDNLNYNFMNFERDCMESKYGLVDESHFEYFPASANQTPIKWLLYSDFIKTLDFIINFTNTAVEAYNRSDYGKDELKLIKINLNEIVVEQYISNALWQMYRGTGSPVVPYLLQSMHMALETALLEVSEIWNLKDVEYLLQYILLKSKSASLTSIVCSVVLAYPEKFFDIAIVLFKTVELFHFDSRRGIYEHEAKSLNSMGYGLNTLTDKLYTDERLKACEDKHRKRNLESLFLDYQFCGVKGFSEDQNREYIYKLYNIIDSYKSDEKLKNEYGVLLARMDRRNLKAKTTVQDDDNVLIELTPIELSSKDKLQSEKVAEEKEELFKYSTLKLWSDFISDKKYENEIYDKKPKLALKKTKELIKELNSGNSKRGFFDYSIPPYVCSKLVIYYNNILSKKDKIFCKKIITSTILLALNDNYRYQISDGVEAAIRAVPFLFDDFPDEIDYYTKILTTILFDETSIGYYKRICDYVIESIQKSLLWEKYEDIAINILTSYINQKPFYKKARATILKNQDYSQRISKESILTCFEASIDVHTLSLLDLTSLKLEALNFFDFEIILLLIPTNTNKKGLLNVIEKIISLIANKLFNIENNVNGRAETQLYYPRLHIFEWLASFILQRKNTNEIDLYLQPLINSMGLSNETASFLTKLIFAQDKLKQNNNFWYLWEKMYPKIADLCSRTSRYHLQEVISNYLLAWDYWREGITSWHSLENKNIKFYTSVCKDLGEIHVVLYSISKILNSIASNFKDEGINWLNMITVKNQDLDLQNLESATIFYLEKFLRKYIFENRLRIKQDVKLKNKVLPILAFMIEKGSVHGYLLRESLL